MLNRSINKKLFTPSSLLLFLGVCLIPLYLLPSGTMQVSDWLIGLYAAYYISTNGLRLNSADRLLLLLIFVVFTREVVSSITLIDEDWTFLLQTLYIIFGFLVFQVIRRTLITATSITLLRWGILISIVIAILGLIFLHYDPAAAETRVRAVGTFNNPNQLGYFAVCVFSINSLLVLTGHAKKRFYFISISMCLFLAAASLSKAAMVSLIVATLFSGFALGEKRSRFALGVLTFAIMGGLALYLYASGAFDDWKIMQRLADIGQQSDDSLAGRGYIPWFNEGVLAMVFGLSKPSARVMIGPGEVHATVASFFIYYGLLGGLIFVGLMYLWVRNVWHAFHYSGLILVCMPALLYGLTHNGSRFTAFWVLLATSFALANSNKSTYSPKRLLNNTQERLSQLPASI